MRQHWSALALFALVAAGCGETTAPPTRYLAEVQGVDVPAAAAPADTVHVRFSFTLRDCGSLEAIEIRQTYMGAEFSVWARPASPFVDCVAAVFPPVQVDYLIQPYSRAPEFEVVVRQEGADLVRTIAYPVG